VLTVEPMPSDHPFYAVENKHRLLITPHTAWASDEARDVLMKLVCENIRNNS